MIRRGNAMRYMISAILAFARSRRTASHVLLGLEHLPAAIHAGLEIDVVRPAQLAGILVLDVGRLRERVGGTAHPAARRRCFSFRDGHVVLLICSVLAQRALGKPGL